MDVIALILFLYLLLKGKYAWVLFGIILLTTSYLGAGTNLSTFPVQHNVSDAGLVLYIALCVRILVKARGRLTSQHVDKTILAIYLFLFFSFLVDILLNKVELISIIKTSRHWIFLTCFWIFYYIPQDENEKMLTYLLYSTIIISIIGLSEFFFEIRILDIRQTTEIAQSGAVFTRSSIPSSFNYFFIYLIFTDYFLIRKWIKYCLISLLVVAIIVSMVRSLIIAFVIGILIIIFKRKHILKSFNFAVIVALILLIITLLNPLLKERFISGFHEIQNLDITSKRPVGNVSFRIYHIQERVEYISHNMQYSFLGIGNIIEDDFPQIFSVGLLKENGERIQLDTGDNAWAVLFIRLGFVGTFLYLLFYFKVLSNFKQSLSYSSLSLSLFVYLLINLAILSFASSTIVTGQFWLFPALIYHYISKENV